MGLARVLHRLFTGSSHAEVQDDAVVMLAKQVRNLGLRVEQLETELSDTKAQLQAFRGRVYAWKRFEPAPEPPTEPAELPLTDPRVTKQELRSRLLKPGKPFKHN